eukprot:4831783-Lingulodinium_polyedra.AAC.1
MVRRLFAEAGGFAKHFGVPGLMTVAGVEGLAGPSATGFGGEASPGSGRSTLPSSSAGICGGAGKA